MCQASTQNEGIKIMSEDGNPRIIKSLSRLPNTENGNPRYRLYLADGDALLTKPDAAVAYSIDNSEYQNVPVELTLDGGQVIGIKTVNLSDD